MKKWGLAPMTGSLAPPPPYGSEQGSILLEGGREGIREGQGFLSSHGRSQSAQIRLGRGPTSPGPQRSPTDISLAQLSFMDAQTDDIGEGTSSTPLLQDTRPNAGLAIDMTDSDGDAPPPDYESPEEDQQDDPTTPKANAHPPRTSSQASPPIPSYEAATAVFEANDEGREQDDER